MNGVRIVALLALVAAPFAAGLAPARAQNAALVDQGRRAFMNQGCHGCHRIGAMGTPIGPDLSHVGAKYRADYLARWLRDPAYLRPSTHMPAIELTDDDIRSIAAFLAEQQ